MLPKQPESIRKTGIDIGQALPASRAEGDRADAQVANEPLELPRDDKVPRPTMSVRGALIMPEDLVLRWD